MSVTKPEFIQEAETAWDTTTPKETPSITVQKGDVVVAFADCEEVTEEKANLSNPTGGGLVWTLKRRNLKNQFNETAIWTATATEAKTFKVTFARGATSRRFGGNVLVFRKASGIGASAQAAVSSGAPTLNITTEKEHSAVVVAVGDWAAVDGKSRVWRTNAGAFTEQTYNFLTGVWTVYGGFHADAGAAGTYAVGLSAPAGQKYSIVAVEVFGEESKSEAVEMEAAISGSGALTGTLTSVAAISTSLSGAGSLTGELRAVAAMEAPLSGSGGLTGSLTSIAALSAALSAQGTLSGELSALASMVAGLVGSGSLTGELSALASMVAELEAEGVLDGELTSVASLAAELSGQGSLTGLLEIILGQAGTLPTRARVDSYGVRARIAARELRAVVIPSRVTRAAVLPNSQTAATVTPPPATAATIVANPAARASIHEQRTKAEVL